MMVRSGKRVLSIRGGGAALVALALVTAFASAPAPATTERQPLPWNTFGEAAADVVSVEQVTCPKTPDEPVLKARLIHDGAQYIYLAKDRRWLVWRVPSGRPNDATPGYVWFGNHGPADDVLRVVSAMPYDDAQRYFRGPCGWIDPNMI
jgi:hypothetical protein